MERIEASRIYQRFTRALDSYDSQADAQHQISRKLAFLLSQYTGIHYHRILEIGCGTGGFTRCLKNKFCIDEWVLNDLCDGCFEKIEKLFPSAPPFFISGDAEHLSFPGQFDLIASASTFQWMKQLELFLHKLSTYLVPHGILLFSTFAPGNLHEIKKLTGKGLSYPTADELCKWLSSDFNLLHCKEEDIILTFHHPLDVLKHLKATGVTATGKELWTRGTLNTFSQRYSEQFQTIHNQVTLTYRPLYILAAKK